MLLLEWQTLTHGIAQRIRSGTTYMPQERQISKRNRTTLKALRTTNAAKHHLWERQGFMMPAFQEGDRPSKETAMTMTLIPVASQMMVMTGSKAIDPSVKVDSEDRLQQPLLVLELLARQVC